MITLQQIYGLKHCVKPTEPNTIILDLYDDTPRNRIRTPDGDIDVYQLLPTRLKNEKGEIFENWWQSQRLFPEIGAQLQTNDNDEITWQHCSEEHVSQQGEICPEYFDWRRKLRANKYPVKRPNGAKDDNRSLGILLWKKRDNAWRLYDDVRDQKRFYSQEYERLLRYTHVSSIFFKLVSLLKTHNFLMVDTSFEGKAELSTENLRDYFHKKGRPSHAWVLAALLKREATRRSPYEDVAVVSK